MTQVLQVRVISQQPPGGRCALYAGYAEALAEALGAQTEVVFSAERGAHGAGFPSLLINGVTIQPEDGAILMPADLRASLVAAGCDGDRLAQAEAALEAPVQRLLGGR